MCTSDNEKDMMQTTSPWYVESNMGEITPEDWAFLAEHSERLCYKKGDYIFEYGVYIHNIFYINQGTVKYCGTNSEGESKTYFYTNRFLALECFFHGQPTHTNAIAIEDVEIFALDPAFSNEALARESIRNLAFKALSGKCRILGWQVEDLSLSKPLSKVCRLLCCYVSEDKPHYKITLTHQELASLTGLHRVTITSNISQLRKSQIIQTDINGHITVLDWARLKALGFDGCI